MTHTRMDEASINASLDRYLHGAREGDVNQARRLHEMLDNMLTGTDSEGGQLWLTEHGRLLLARMHRQLSHCEGTGHDLEDDVLDAVWLKPHRGHWDDSCSFVNDMRIAIAVADEICQQRKAGQELDFESAVKAVEKSGGYDKSAEQIADIYEEIASTVGGFREMSSC